MRRDELLFDKIEDYLRGKMPPAAAAAFEAEIAADAELAALVRLHRLERRGQEWLVERDLLSKMGAWEREAEKPPSFAPVRVSFVRHRWMAGVAATILLGAFGWWLMRPQADIGGPPMATAPKIKTPVTAPSKKTPKSLQKPSATSPQEQEDDRVVETQKPAPTLPTPKPTSPTAAPNYPALAAAYYREDDFISKSGENGTGADSPGYGQALDSYKSGKYSDAEKLLKPILKSNPDALKTKELLAHSLYKKKQYDTAIPYFRQLANASDKAVAERSQWALALTLLHKMPAQKTSLNRVLDEILAKPGHIFFAKAKNLKTQLGK